MLVGSSSGPRLPNARPPGSAQIAARALARRPSGKTPPLFHSRLPARFGRHARLILEPCLFSAKRCPAACIQRLNEREVCAKVVNFARMIETIQIEILLG